jgi:glutamyl-tRNA(Gln) amidotransferase subunit E
MRLVGFAGLLGKELQPNKRFGTELSDRAKVASGVGGLFHSDELPNYGITPDEVEMLKAHFKCGRDDAFILVADLKLKAERALETAAFRAGIALKGVPKEVRRANPDGTTTFMRPMPGAARMYPETDVLPVRITKKLLDSVPVPELIEKKVARFEKMGLSKDVASAVAKSEGVLLFEDCVKKFKDLKPSYIAEILIGAQAQIRREFNVEINPSDDDYFSLFEALSKNKIAKENVVDVLKENRPVVDVLSQFKQMSDADLKSALKKIVDKNKGLPFNALIGKAMAELRGKASGQKIVEMLKTLV